MLFRSRDAIVTYAAEMHPGKIKGTIRSQVERIDALFRCLVLVSGVEEASIAVLGRLEQFSQSERDLLQNIAVASHFRMLQSSISFPEGAFAKAGSLNILRSAMRMRPTHPEVTALLDAFYSSNPNNDLATSIVHVMGSDKDRLMRVLYWTKGVIDAKEDHESATIQWSNDDTDILVGLATHWVHKSQIGRAHV